MLDQTLGTSPGGRPPDPALSEWARRRGLSHQAEGLLPPVTPRLRAGLGIGTQKSFRTKPGAGSFGSTLLERGEKRPERATHDICVGTLPGGLDGLLAHHTHLADDTSDEGADLWLAWTSTVVFAELGEASRGIGTASAGPRTSARALLSFGRPRSSSDPRRTMVPPPVTRDVRDGLTWTISPAEDAATLEELVGASSRALAAAPAGVEVELEFGMLCVWVGRELTDAAELDALCRAASAVAQGVRAATERNPLLAAEFPTVGQPSNDRRRWIDAGVATVEWTEPPASVPAAVAAYERVVRGRAHRVGWATALVLLAVLLGLSATGIWIGLETGMAAGGVITAIFAVVLVIAILRASLQTAREVARDEIDARARPWGMEAFLRGYAGARALTLEDPNAVRRRLASPVRGHAVGAAHGRIAEGIDGHLIIWLEPGAGTPSRYWLLAAVPAPGHVPAPPPPYHAEVREGLLVVGVLVDEADRSATALDRLAAVAASLAPTGALAREAA
jgi:hypothetical protein